MTAVISFPFRISVEQAVIPTPFQRTDLSPSINIQMLSFESFASLATPLFNSSETSTFSKLFNELLSPLLYCPVVSRLSRAGPGLVYTIFLTGVHDLTHSLAPLTPWQLTLPHLLPSLAGGHFSLGAPYLFFFRFRAFVSF